jgi:hypothetical protein
MLCVSLIEFLIQILIVCLYFRTCVYQLTKLFTVTEAVGEAKMTVGANVTSLKSSVGVLDVSSFSRILSDNLVGGGEV